MFGPNKVKGALPCQMWGRLISHPWWGVRCPWLGLLHKQADGEKIGEFVLSGKCSPCETVSNVTIREVYQVLVIVPGPRGPTVKVKVSGFILHLFYSTSHSGVNHAVTVYITCLYHVSVHQTAPPVTGDGFHLLAAYYLSIYPERMKGWVGLVGLLVADGLPTEVVTRQLWETSQVKDRCSTTVPRTQPK